MHALRDDWVTEVLSGSFAAHTALDLERPSLQKPEARLFGRFTSVCTLQTCMDIGQPCRTVVKVKRRDGETLISGFGPLLVFVGPLLTGLDPLCPRWWSRPQDY